MASERQLREARQSWGERVARLLGPRFKPADRENQRQQALHLAAAALRAAGHTDMAANAESLIFQSHWPGIAERP